jgi:hypothetical protein
MVTAGGPRPVHHDSNSRSAVMAKDLGYALAEGIVIMKRPAFPGIRTLRILLPPVLECIVPALDFAGWRWQIEACL